MTYLRTIVFGLSIILGTAFSAACAEKTDLACQMTGFAGDGLNVSIDPTASTVTLWSTSSARSQGQTVKAIITDDAVKWTTKLAVDVNSVVSDRFTLDRNTGQLNVSHTNRKSDTWACTKSTRVF